MKERILKLAKEAGMRSPDLFKLTVSHMSTDTLEKFAELIVEECARRAEAYAYMSPNFTALAEELRRMNGVAE
jgi:hypothetical protein